MASEASRYSYKAISASGRRVRGHIDAASEADAFAQLVAQGVSPLDLRRAVQNHGSSHAKLAEPLPGAGRTARKLNDKLIAELLSSLAALLQAGADIRSALSILGSNAAQAPVQAFCRTLSNQISGGEAVDAALARQLKASHQFVAALAAAGQASGDLAGGIERASSILTTRIKLREQLVSALSYPAFVFISAIGAVLVILLFIIPAMAPLAQDNGATPPATLALMIGASDLLRQNLFGALMATGLAGLLLIVAARLGLLAKPVDQFLMRGPFRGIASAMVFGGYAIALGSMLSAGAPMSDALRLASRTIRSPMAKSQLDALSQQVRQGRSLSSALQGIKAMPPAVYRLASVGEAAGALGSMLVRAGEMEEGAAIARIEAVGRLLGPILIILLGGMIGTMMAGLLSGLSQLGGAALQ